MSDKNPFSYQFLFERWADALKVLGAGNGTGLLASAASLQLFVSKPELAGTIKSGGVLFLIGVIFFGLVFALLTVLLLAFEKFFASSDRTYADFREMISAFGKADKSAGRSFLMVWICALVSLCCFLAGCYMVLGVVLHF
jgi:hypothetical protein